MQAPSTFPVDGSLNGLFGTSARALEDWQVNGAVSGSTQQTMGFGKDSISMTYADTQDPNNNFITYQDRNTLPRYTKDDLSDQIGRGFVDKIKTGVTGTVNVDAYVAWLKLNGYSSDNLRVQR